MTYIDYVRPRDLVGAVRAVSPIREAARRIAAVAIVSTGAAVAVSGAIAARRDKIPFTYIESLARVDRLSTTAKILSPVPGVDRFVQSEALVSNRFSYAGSILDDFTIEKRLPREESERLRIFVTLGTIRPYGFNRLLAALDELTKTDDVVWQVGESTYVPSHGLIVRSMDRGKLLEQLRIADVVVSHAGVGSILAALGEGRVPLVVSRKKKFGEHIDDHQLDIARMLDARGLVRSAEVDEIDRGMLVSTTGLLSKVRVAS
ncbi:glycosyltransferase [Microbacterium sp. P05]|uniref:glycosyltransferase n=1 Tax=Microbacterium sp. P05 TaxID=3366948 RepID=UPI003746265B